MPTEHALSERCRTLAQGVEDAKNWLTENAGQAGSEFAPLLAGLRRSGRLLRRCARAAERKMCVGVFGPSQAGKSYLISALARDRDGTLSARFGDTSVDFLERINPEGNKESTGQVTRFTLTPPPMPDSAFPVYVRLLSEADIVKILANTYYEDWKHGSSRDRSQLVASLEALAKRRVKGAGNPTLDVDELEEIEEYVTAKARLSPAGSLLDGAYWTRVREFAPDLRIEDRAELFSHIWGQNPECTRLFVRLGTALAQLGFAPDAHCGLEALLPRESSIIDVDRLDGLLDASAQSLPVLSGTGARVELPRPVMTAITAELVIYMDSGSAQAANAVSGATRQGAENLFEHTDLLDFPGYRARMDKENIDQLIVDPAILKDSYLRGKVAYLFERYSAQKELTSMLLCVGPGNQDAQSLPRAVNAWIAETHGATPEARKGRAAALFLVLTKFDMEFEDKRGASATPEGRWGTRIHTSFLDFFGKEFKWPENWDGSPFNNLFWLRNPDFKAPGLFAYEDGREMELRPDQRERVEWLRQGFLNLDEARANFKNPVAAFEAAMSLNDGGISYLLEHLRPLCNPRLKYEQVAAMVAREAAGLVARLTPFHRDDDLSREREKQAAKAKKLVAALARTVSVQRFAELLRGLQLEDYRYYNLYYQMQSDRALGHASGAAEPDGTAASARMEPDVILGTRTSAEDILSSLFGGGEAAAPSPGGSRGPGGSQESSDDAAQFSRLIENAWTAHMTELAENPEWQQYFGLAPADFAALVHELALGASRHNIIHGVEEKIREATSYRNINPERMIWRQVSLAALGVNSFVNWLSFSPYALSATERTVDVDGREHILFEQPDLQSPYPEISEERPAFDRDYYLSWLSAFMVLARDNTRMIDPSFNPEQNARLGRVLGLFERAGGTA